MSPILVRPVREQLEHDRVIRLLQTKSRRKYEVGINPGAERSVPVGSGADAVYPDLVLLSQERGRRLEAVVEVETGESVNHLEALAQWAHFAKLRAAFHLYVPSSMMEVARRLCDDNHIVVSEIWSYHGVGDDVRFTLVHRSREQVSASSGASRAGAAGKKPAPKKAAPKKAAPKKPSPKKPARPSARRVTAPKKKAAGKTVGKKAARPARRK